VPRAIPAASDAAVSQLVAFAPENPAECLSRSPVCDNSNAIIKKLFFIIDCFCSHCYLFYGLISVYAFHNSLQ
jgi:hypothetical protein